MSDLCKTASLGSRLLGMPTGTRHATRVLIVVLMVAFWPLAARAQSDAKQQTKTLNTAGHDDKTFYLGSADRRFLMRLNGLLQMRWIGNFRGDESARASVSPDDNIEMGFEFRRIELGVSGHVWDSRLKYALVLAAATDDSAALVERIVAQDVLLSYAVTDQHTIAAGRFFAPFIREELIGGGGMMAVGQSTMNALMSVGRGEGVSITYQPEILRTTLFISDGAGSGGGGDKSFFADGADIGLTARVDFRLAGEWGQWNHFSAWSGESTAVFIGAAVHGQQGESGDPTPPNDLDRLHWTVDASLQHRGANLYAAGAGAHIRSSTGESHSYGQVFQAGYMIVPDVLEPFARYEHIWFNAPIADGGKGLSLVTAGANWHMNRKAKIGADVVWALDPMPVDVAGAGLLADGVAKNQIAARILAHVAF